MAFKETSSANTTTIIYTFTHLCVGGFAYLVGSGFQIDNWNILFALAVSGVFGFIMARPLHEGFNLIEGMLERLLKNESVSEISLDGREPLRKLVALVNQFAAQQRETSQMRGQLYHQISEAAAQEERNRLARDLHDSIKQQIFSISVSAAAVQARLEHDPVGARAALLDVRQSAQEAMVEMRAMLQQLSPAPLEKLGLLQALRDQCEALAYRTSTHVSTDFGTLPSDDVFPPGAQEALFRIAQEALSNVARHARARNVSLSLKQIDLHIVLSIQDDGQGFNPQEAVNGMGLSNVRKRAEALKGDVSIESAPNTGTTLRIAIPLVDLSIQEQEAERIHLQEKYNRILPLQYGFALSLGAAIYAFSLLATRILTPKESDTIISVLMVILVALGVVTLPGSIWAYFRSRHLINELVISLDREGVLWLKLRRHIHQSWLLLFGIAAWFTPIMWIEGDLPDWLPLATATPLLVLLIYQWVRAQQAYNQLFDKLHSTELAAELQRRYQERFSGWFSFGFLLFVLFATGFWEDVSRISLFPADIDQWMTTYFLIAVIFLMVNLLYETWYYRKLKKLQEREA